LILRANFMKSARFPCPFMIRANAGHAVDGATIYSPRAARFIHSADDVIAALSLTRPFDGT
jgi:hypothetical protein